MSISNTRCSSRTRAADKFTAVVVLPTPPFWLTTANTGRDVFSSVDIATQPRPSRMSKCRSTRHSGRATRGQANRRKAAGSERSVAAG